MWVSNYHDTNDAPRGCPDCLKPMEKLPAAPNFVLKGAGFHVNDYKKGDTP